MPHPLSEEEAIATAGQIKNLITDSSGTLEKESKPVKKRFGYKINEFQEGFMITFSFSSSPELTKPLEEKIKNQENVLRHMLLAKATPSPLKQGRRQPLPQKQEEKAGLKEIDEKIDQILKE